jgi:hypothetical protein
MVSREEMINLFVRSLRAFDDLLMHLGQASRHDRVVLVDPPCGLA